MKSFSFDLELLLDAYDKSCFFNYLILTAEYTKELLNLRPPNM